MSSEAQETQSYLTLPIEKTSDFTLEDFAGNHQAMNYYHRYGADTCEHAFTLANILHMHKLVREAAGFYGLAYNLHSKQPDQYPLASSLLQARLLCLLKAGLSLPEDELLQLKQLSETIYDYISGIAISWRDHDPAAALARMKNCFESFHTGEEVDVLYLETALAVLPPAAPDTMPSEMLRIPRSIYMYWDKKPPEEVQENYEYHCDLELFDVQIFDRDEGAQWLYEYYGREAQDLFLKARHAAEAADFLRAHVICEKGGMWLDADIRITAPDHLETLLGRNPSHLFFLTENYYVHNDFFAAEKNSSFLHDCLLSIYRNSYAYPSLYIAYKTGPGVFNRALNRRIYNSLRTKESFDPATMIERCNVFDSIITDMNMAYKQGGNWHAA